jgi:hypothetical protein
MLIGAAAPLALPGGPFERARRTEFRHPRKLLEKAA